MGEKTFISCCMWWGSKNNSEVLIYLGNVELWKIGMYKLLDWNEYPQFIIKPKLKLST